MVVARSLSPRERGDGGMGLEILQRSAEILEQGGDQISRHAIADEDALDDEVFAIRRHAVGGDLPTTHSQAVGEIVETERDIGTVLDFPAYAGDAAMRVTSKEDFEGAELGEFRGKKLSRIVARLVDFAVALAAEAEILLLFILIFIPFLINFSIAL